MKIHAKSALTSEGWKENVTLTIGANGRIADVSAEDELRPGHHRVGHLLPAPANVHSHAFQRAMAGLTEQRGPDQSDSFWTWRRLMFRFLDQLTPGHVEAITAFVQMEMLEAGFGASVEFHYVHHQPGGNPYANLAELSERIVSAAETSGIGLTLLPVHYQYGGCDKRSLGAGQVRFGNDLEQFGRLHENAAKAIARLGEDAALGLAPHSLRAVAAEDIPALIDLAGAGPVHLHLAEQVAEVEEVKAAWGKRPVEWLLDNVDVDRRWCLIHCTQMLPHETEGLAKSGAVAGLCPITESSLGDGIFDGVNWLDHGGAIAVGSDSNIRISLSEELRTLDYSQRLRDHSRAALATDKKSTGRRLLDEVNAGGAQAANRKSGRIEVGQWADLLALDADHIDFINRTGGTILDSYVFAGDDRMVTDVWSAGRHLVQSGSHIRRTEITDAYRRVMNELKTQL